jgi:molybdopterin synthase catalytic subunit
MRAAIVRRPLDVAALLREVESARNGASVLFVGTVREENGGRPVMGIEYAAYEPMAVRELEAIVTECCGWFGTDHVVAEHRIGYLAIGEASVAIAAAHPHRKQAYDASRFVIEQIKLRLPVWKREAYVDGTREWVRSARETENGGQEPEQPAPLSARPDVEPTRAEAVSRFPLPASR